MSSSNYSWYLTFHGGSNSDSNNLNNVYQFKPDGEVDQPSTVLNTSNLEGITLRELRGICYGPDGNLYVVNAYKKYSQVLSFAKELNENGQHEFLDEFINEEATETQNYHPYQCVFGPDGNAYVSNQDTVDVRQYYGPGPNSTNPNKGKLMGVYIKGSTDTFQHIRGIEWHDDYLYIADHGQHVWKVAKSSDGETSCTQLVDDKGLVNEPIQLLVHGNLMYIGNKGGENILVIDLEDDGATIEVCIETGTGNNKLNGPSGLAIVKDKNGDKFLYVGDRDNNRVVSYQLSSDGMTGEYLGEVITDLADNPEFILPVPAASDNSNSEQEM